MKTILNVYVKMSMYNGLLSSLPSRFLFVNTLLTARNYMVGADNFGQKLQATISDSIHVFTLYMECPKL